MMKMSRIVLMFPLVAALVASAGPGSEAQGPAPKDAPAIESWWADLEKDEPEAIRAVIQLAARPAETTAFFKPYLIPLAIDEGRVRFLVTMLGDEDEAVWRPAFEELDYLDPRLAIGPEEAMDLAPTSPARQRLADVLKGRPAGSSAGKTITVRKVDDYPDGFTFYGSPGATFWRVEAKVAGLVGSGSVNPKKKWLRAIRAIALLKSFGTPEAIDLIKAMATGHADAQPTKVARAALERADAGAVADCWADLEKDEPEATPAALTLLSRPRETTAFLKDKLPPLAIDAGRVQFLLTMLGDENEAVWKPAFEELEYYDPRLAIDLEELMTQAPVAPKRLRLIEVLSGRGPGWLNGQDVTLNKITRGERTFFNFRASPGNKPATSWVASHKVENLRGSADQWGNPKKKWLRAVRAIALLESFGTPEAIDIIKAMATGHADAQPTKVARMALERLGVKAG